MSDYRELTTFEIEALRAFAKAHKSKASRTFGCADWRDELSAIYWYNARIWTGPVPGMGAALHSIRNEFGPTWLYDTYKLPKGNA